MPKLNRLYDSIAAEGAQPLLYPLDLEGASPDDYAEMATRIESELGRLDGVLHCAAEFRGLTPLLHTDPADFARALHVGITAKRSEEHTSELQSLMRISYAVFCLKKKKTLKTQPCGSHGVCDATSTF